MVNIWIRIRLWFIYIKLNKLGVDMSDNRTSSEDYLKSIKTYEIKRGTFNKQTEEIYDIYCKEVRTLISKENKLRNKL